MKKVLAGLFTFVPSTAGSGETRGNPSSSSFCSIIVPGVIDTSSIPCLVVEQVKVANENEAYTGRFTVLFRALDDSIQVDCNIHSSTNVFSYVAKLKTSPQQEAVKKFIKKDGSFSRGMTTRKLFERKMLLQGNVNFWVSEVRAARYVCEAFESKIDSLINRARHEILAHDSDSSLPSVDEACTSCVRKEFNGCTLVFYPTMPGVQPVLEDIESCQFLEEGNPNEDILLAVEAKQRVTENELQIDCTDEGLSNQIFASFMFKKFVPTPGILEKLTSWFVTKNADKQPEGYNLTVQKHVCSQLRKKVRRFYAPPRESCWFNLPDIDTPIGIELSLHCLPPTHQSLGTNEPTNDFEVEVTGGRNSLIVTVVCRLRHHPNQFFTYQTSLKMNGVEESVRNFIKLNTMSRSVTEMFMPSGKLVDSCDSGDQYVCKSAAQIDVCDRYGPTIFPSLVTAPRAAKGRGGSKPMCSFVLPEGLALENQSSMPCLLDSKQQEGRAQRYGGRFEADIIPGDINGEVKVVCTRDGDVDNQFTYITNFETQSEAVRIFMKPITFVSGIKKWLAKLTKSLGEVNPKPSLKVKVLAVLFHETKSFKNSKGKEVDYVVSPERAAKYVCEHYRPKLFGATNKRTCPNQSLCTHDEFEPSSGYCSFTIPLYGDPASMAQAHKGPEEMTAAYEEKGLSCLEYDKSSTSLQPATKPADSKKTAKVSIMQSAPYVKVECFDDGYAVFTYTTSLFDKNIRFFVKEQDSNLETMGVVQDATGLGELKKYFDKAYDINGRIYRTSDKRASVQVCELYQPKIDMVLSGMKNRCSLLSERASLPDDVDVWACNNGSILRIGEDDCSYTLEHVFVPRETLTIDQTSISVSDTQYLGDRIGALKDCPSNDAASSLQFSESTWDRDSKRFTCVRKSKPFGSVWIKDASIQSEANAPSVCSGLYSSYWIFYPETRPIYRSGMNDYSELILSTQEDAIIFKSSKTFYPKALTQPAETLEKSRAINKGSSDAARLSQTQQIEEDDGDSLYGDVDGPSDDTDIDEDSDQVTVADNGVTEGSSIDDSASSNDIETQYTMREIIEPGLKSSTKQRRVEDIIQVVELPSQCETVYYPSSGQSFLELFFGSNPITKTEYTALPHDRKSKVHELLQDLLNTSNFGTCLDPDDTRVVKGDPGWIEEGEKREQMSIRSVKSWESDKSVHIVAKVEPLNDGERYLVTCYLASEDNKPYGTFAFHKSLTEAFEKKSGGMTLGRLVKKRGKKGLVARRTREKLCLHLYSRREAVLDVLGNAFKRGHIDNAAT